MRFRFVVGFDPFTCLPPLVAHAQAGVVCLCFLRSFVARHPCLFSLASGERVTFSCVAKRRVTKEKATPIQRSPGSATAPALLYLLHPCSRPALRLRNATPGVRRQSIRGLASNWAQSIAPTLRAIPPSRCRCIGGPDTAHPAQPSQSGFPQAGALGFGFGFAFGIGAHDAR
jgi:hypothetical protein